MYDTTEQFVQALDQAGELKRVAARVSPVLEITEIADRVSKSPAPNLGSQSTRRTDPRFHHLGGSALLFENVEGSDIPVLINALGSYRRIEMALGCSEKSEVRSAGRSDLRADSSSPSSSLSSLSSDAFAITNERQEIGSESRPTSRPTNQPTNQPVTGLEALAERIGKLVKPEPPPTLLAKLQKIPELLELVKIPPKKVKSGPCQDVVKTGDDIDLTRLPLLRCWPHDGDYAALGYPANINDGIPGLGSGPDWEKNSRGRYITLGGIHTIHADDLGNPQPTSRNIGMYRVQLLGKKHMAMHWHMHHDGARHWRSWKAKGQRMPVAIAIGGESVLPYAATAPMPPGISEFLLAGFLNRGPIPLVACKTVPIDVPANADIVIEGYVSNEAGFIDWDPRENPLENSRDKVSRGVSPRPGPGAVFEGPFGDHTGFYSLPDRYPLLEVTAITHRRRPIYQTTIVGLPPQEDYFLGKATERIFLPLLRTIVPDIIDYDLPLFGCFHNCAFLKIKKEYPLHARRVMHAIWGAGQMSWTKTIVVVDSDVDVHDRDAVLRAVGEHCEPARDSELVRGPLDILDHAAPFLGAGGKLGLDATCKSSPAETHRAICGRAAELCATGPIPAAVGSEARATESLVKSLPGVRDARVPDELGGHWLVLQADKHSPGDGTRVIKALGGLADQCALPRWTIVVGPDAELTDLDRVLFHWMAHSSHERDRSLSVCGRRVAFEGMPKVPGDEAHGWPVRAWPPILKMEDVIKRGVTERWREYGI